MNLGNERTLFCMTDVAEAWILRDLSFGEVRSILASRKRENDRFVFLWTEAWTEWKSLDDSETQIFKSPRRETQKPPALPLVPFLVGDEDIKKATPKIPAARLGAVPSVAKPQLAPGPVASKKSTSAPNLQSLKRENPRAPRKREVTNGNFSMDELVAQLEPPEPQTLEPFPKEDVKPIQARVTGDTEGGNRRYTRYAVNIPVKIVNNTQEFVTLTKDIGEGGVRLADTLPDAFAGYCQVVLTPADRAPLHLLCSLVEDQQHGKRHLEFVDSESQADFIAWLRRQKWAAA